jgi:zinc transporter ZupT
VTRCLRSEHHHHHDTPMERRNRTTEVVTTSSFDRERNEAKQAEDEPEIVEDESNKDAPICPSMCCSDNPTQDLARIQNMALEIEKTEEDHGKWEGRTETEPRNFNNEREDSENDVENKVSENVSHDKKIMSMSINTAVAIALHNFPEGLATFVAALHNPRVGAVLAVAIALHNIPEGLCVALPIYYATGKRWKAFIWACLSGISEPIAAVLGWAILARTFSAEIYGTLFGIVSGMMIIISIRELLPTAHRYDPEDSVVTYSFMAGMTIMALSLVLFVL